MGLFSKLLGPSLKSSDEIDAMTYEDRIQYFAKMRRYGKSINTGKKRIQSSNIYDTKADLARIDGMEGHAFEYWCAQLLKDSDFYNVEVTKGSNDDGVDVIAFKDGKRWGFQCKRYNSSLGKPSVQQICTGLKPYNCQVGVVMTSNYFTKGAIVLAETNGIRLWDRNKIIELLNNRRWYQYEDDRLWPHNRNTGKINYDYYASLPPVPLRENMQKHIKCWPIDGDEDHKVNPYEDTFAEELGLDYSLVEVWSGFLETQSEAQHFLDAITKRYYALSPNGVNPPNECNPGYSFAAYVHGNLIKDKFDFENCCWALENWA